MALLRVLAITAKATRYGYQILVSVVMSWYLVDDFLDRKKHRKRE